MTFFLLLAALALFALASARYGVDSRTYPDGLFHDRMEDHRPSRA